MKTISIIMIIFCLKACADKQPPTHFIFLCDVSDTLSEIQNLTPTAVLKQVLNDKSTVFWEACTVTFSEINDGRMTNSSTFSVPQETSMTSDEIQRIASIDTFKRQICEEVHHIVTSPKTNNTSAIFEKIMFEIEQLNANKNSEETALYIFSDLIQNTQSCSFYSKNDFEKLMQSDSIWFKSVFTKGRPIPNLSKFSLYLIHTSSTPQEDEIFYIVANNIHVLLEPYGARVSISSGL
ncbi:MAG: hypothetical protein ACOYMA_08525 [Bacteroidia bacterium]